MTLVETHDNETKDGIDAKQLNLELCSDASQADIVITAVRMKKRLERHLDWNMVVSGSANGYPLTVISIIISALETKSYRYP